MNFSKLVFALALTSFMTLVSCSTEDVDPRVGTWESEVETTLFGDTYLEVIYYINDKVTVNLKLDPSGSILAGTTASSIKEINSTTNLYEITSGITLGQPATVDKPFYKASIEVDGNTMTLTTYEADSIASVAESMTVFDTEITLKRE